MQISQTYTVPELAEIFDIPVTKVRRMLEEHTLVGVHIDGVLRIPQEFVQDGQPLASLRGTVTVLLDAGLTVPEAIAWLLDENPQLGDSPVALLRKNHKAPVRRAAAMLAI